MVYISTDPPLIVLTVTQFMSIYYGSCKIWMTSYRRQLCLLPGDATLPFSVLPLVSWLYAGVQSS